ncbi:MAG: TerB family tellurite resistance protein [Candidatus Marinimicrobia bacterium]|nr:TerB family tellurite resistance protein [Candidatus Neomarinimicrobiota bacterium]
MSWFKNTKPQKAIISEMTPLELVTDLLVCLQLADNKVDYNEREAWNNTLTKLFPDHNPGHAEEALKKSFNEINDLEQRERDYRITKLIAALVTHFPAAKIKKEIVPDLIKLIEADGIVLSAELDMVKIIEQALDDSTKYYYD